MSVGPFELWEGVRGECVRDLTLNEAHIIAKIQHSEQWILDVMLSGYGEVYQYYYLSVRDRNDNVKKIYPFHEDAMIRNFMQRFQNPPTFLPYIQNEREKDFYKEFELLSINKPKE